MGTERDAENLVPFSEISSVFWYVNQSLSSAQSPLRVVGRLGRKKRRARGMMGRGKREDWKKGFSLFPSSPRAFYFFRLLLFLLGYPAGAFAEE